MIYAIGDIHGCNTELKLLLDKVLDDVVSGDIIVFVGDYCDRGPNTKEVIDTVINLRKNMKKQGIDVITLMGNHEKMWLDYIDGIHESLWLTNGGYSTLNSYMSMNDSKHLKSSTKIPQDHLDFLKDLRLFYETKDFFICHAGLNPRFSITQNKLNPNLENTVLWTRELGSDKWDKIVVTGHTPRDEVFYHDKFIGIDTGCVFGNKLTALRLDDLKVYEVYKQ